MKNGLLVLAFFSFLNLSANSFTAYKEHLAKDRLLLIFDKNVSAERKAEIIQSSGVVTTFTHLPSPALTICMTNNFEEAQTFFSSVPEVTFVSFFITDGQDHYAGVLNNFFVKLKDKNFEPLLKEKLKQLNLGEATSDKYIPNLYKITNPNSKIQNTIDACALFLNEGWVEYASPNYLLNPLVSSDALFNRQWNIKNTGSVIQGNGVPDADMDVDSAWTMTTGDPNIKVSVIDSGVDTLHADLVQNMLPGHDAISDSTDGYPTPAYPNDGHGTCCAGIVAAVKDNVIGCAGVAPTCKIIPVRAFYYILLVGASDPLPYSTSDAFSDAIGWSWSTANADVLSNSWGLPPALITFLPGGTQPVTDAIVTAHTNGRGGKGIAMFFSSGNDNDSVGPIWPAGLAETIAVNATNMCDTRKAPGDCSGENWGGDFAGNLDFSAPGVKITTTDIRGAEGFSNNDYTFTFNGTSAACPNAAAVGALLLSLQPHLRAEDIRNIITQSCDKVGYSYDSSYANGTWCRELGYGRVNAHKALVHSLSYNGVNEAKENAVLNVFPNPVQGTLNIYSGSKKNCTMKIHSITGEKLLQQELCEGLNVSDVSSLPSGIYLVRTDTESGIVTKKVTIISR